MSQKVDKDCSVRLNRNFLQPIPVAKEPGNSKMEDSETNRSDEGIDIRDDVKRGSKISYYPEDNFSDSSESSSSGEEIDIKTSAIAPEKEVKDLVCEFCEKNFKSHKSYLMHKRIHKTKTFSCVLCKSSFSLRGSLMHHMKSYHPESGRHPCEYPRCGKSFDSIKEKNFHHKKHWKYTCKHCKKRYLVKDSMLSHVTQCH